MPTLLAVLCVLAAALCAATDGALLTIDDDAPPSEPAVQRFLNDREATHRALAFGRILAQLGAGASLAVALQAGRHWLLATAVAVAVVVVSESGARAFGDVLGARALRRLVPVAFLATTLLRPVVLFGAWCDGILLHLLPARPDSESREADVERFREVVAAEVADDIPSQPQRLPRFISR